MPAGLPEAMRLALDAQIRVLVDIASGEPVVRQRLPNGVESEILVSASPGDLIRAIETLAKYGLGSPMEMPGDGNGAAVEAQVIVIGGREVRF